MQKVRTGTPRRPRFAIFAETFCRGGSLRGMTRAKWILVLFYVAALVQLGWVASLMPEVVATHYDGAGNPNGWMSRTGMVGFHLGMLGVTALAFVGLPVALRRMSSTLINIPNREYWLAPERRAATLAALQDW